MKLFIDTANLQEIEEASKWPFVSGVTTNPSLIAKEGLTQKEVIERIAQMIDGPISAEVTEETAEGMLAQAHELKHLPERFAVKPDFSVCIPPFPLHPIFPFFIAVRAYSFELHFFNFTVTDCKMSSIRRGKCRSYTIFLKI